MRIRLAVLDSDKNYLSRLSTVFMNKYADKIEFYSFTDEKMAVDNVNTGRIDVFLANENYSINTEYLSPECGFAYIVESPDIEEVHNQKAIAKYQRADLFYKQILSLYAETVEAASSFKKGNEMQSKVIAFTSFSGGAGSSTVAAAFATYAAKCKKKVLYLNFELLGNSDSFFNSEGQFDFSEIIYAIKSKKGNMALKLESAVKQDISGVYFYSASKVALDFTELKAEELQVLLYQFSVCGNYDYIIVDMDFNFKEEAMAVLAIVDRVVFVNDGSEISNVKFERGYEALKIYEQHKNISVSRKAYLFYNKFSNKMSKTLIGADIQELGGVPKFEQATVKQIVEQIVLVTDFSKLMED